MTLDHTQLKEAMEIAFDDVMEQLDALAEIIAPNGVPWDADELKDDAEFVAYVLDLQNRPSPEFSIWSFLPDVNPKLYEDMQKRYERAVLNLSKRGV